MRGLSVVFVGVMGCSGPAGTLDLIPTPGTVSVLGTSSEIEIRARTPEDNVGTGSVTVVSSHGSLRTPVTVQLDSFGSAFVDFTCAATEDERCLSGKSATITAVWKSGAKEASGETLVQIKVPATTEGDCADRADNDTDGLIDCADPDCEAGLCSDGNACITGKRCSQRACVGGAPVVCGAPSEPECMAATATCDPSRGCVYAAVNVGGACSDDNPCTTGDRCSTDGRCVGTTKSCRNPSPGRCDDPNGTCNRSTGQCQYKSKSDGTQCTGATVESERCCGGSCVDISYSRGNCGGCGVACTGSFLCNDATYPLGCGPELGVSGRCGCNENSDCPPFHGCVEGRCSPSACRALQNRRQVSDFCARWCEY